MSKLILSLAILAFIGVAITQVAAADEPAEEGVFSDEVLAESLVQTRISCLIPGGCDLHCKCMGKKGGNCRKGICYCR